MRRKHPDIEVWLVEDNAGGHSKAARVVEAERKEECIRKAPHPPNSPDLNMIEGLWDYEKDRTDEYSVGGGTQADIKRAKAVVIREWEQSAEKAQQLCNSFKDRLERCIRAEGDNNF